METKIGTEAHHFFPCAPDYVLNDNNLKRVGKKSLEWDLNDWKWDGDLFVASPLNSVPLDCRNRPLFPVGAGISAAIGGVSNSSSSCSDEVDPGSNGREKRELEKRRRVVVIEDDEFNYEDGSLTLKIGGHCSNPIMEGEVANCDGKSGKKTKLHGTTSNRAVCQVEDCGADLSNAKDYHRRHKVCDLHSKASRALIGNVMQRFCQQCSRFHVLQEFDEGKRSCRRRLAGHNRRRRKTHPDSVVNGSSLNDDQASSYLLISLLRILSNMHTKSSDQARDQDILSHLLRNFASLAGKFDEKNLSGLLQESQDLLNIGTSVGTSSEVMPTLCSNGPEAPGCLGSSFKINGGTGAQVPQMRAVDQYVTAAPRMPHNGIVTDNAPGGTLQTVSLPKSAYSCPVEDSLPAKADARESTVGRIRLNNIDLNNIYYDSQDCIDGFERSQAPTNLGTGSLNCPSWIQDHSSPPQTSRNSDSASAQSPSSSSGDTQSRTDRIVFKLFGKDPSDFPLVLRTQVLDWLSHSPTDIESYIRPGCVILTIYLRLTESKWDELCCDLSSNLSRLLDVSNDSFWRTGWVYTRVQHRIAFIYNGQVVLGASIPLKSHMHCRISSVKPIAVSVSEKAQFIVRGFNLSRPTTRLLCALEGQYLVQEATHDLVEGTDTLKEHDELQCLSFPCSIPNVYGRGFIEVEDHGLSSGFFPFIVAEQNVCSEIRMLESAIEAVESNEDILEGTGTMDSKIQALDFIQEMGWLLHRSQLRSRLRLNDPNSDGFPFTRFRWLMEFSMDHDWCAVVKKLLDILFDGTVDAGEQPSVELALSQMGLLHMAVRRNCRLLVELLLRYVLDKTESEQKQQVDRGCNSFLFRPDVVGPAGLTPLHVAASSVGSENVLDALTEDPRLVGIKAWKSARDDTGFTPEDYARQRGHYSYIHMVQKKIDKQLEVGHVSLDIPGVLSSFNVGQKQTVGSNSAKVFTSFQINKTELRPIQQYCKLCDQQLAYGNTSRSLAYRPAMLSMVAIAAVCVCVGLLFKSSPEVLCVFGPFRWELLDFGTM